MLNIPETVYLTFRSFIIVSFFSAGGQADSLYLCVHRGYPYDEDNSCWNNKGDQHKYGH